MKVIKAAQFIRLPYPDKHLPGYPLPFVILWTGDVVIDEWGMEYSLNGYYAPEWVIKWLLDRVWRALN